MNIFKKLSIGTYILAAAVVLTIISLIMAGVSGSSQEFPVAEMPAIITFAIFAIILMCGAVVLAELFGDKKWLSVITAIMLVVAVLFLSLCMYNMFMGRSVLMGGIWFSDIDKGYVIAEAALSNGMVSMVFFVLAAIVVSVAAGFKLTKKEA